MIKKKFIREAQGFADAERMSLEDTITIIIQTIKTIWMNRYGTDSLNVFYDKKLGDLVFQKRLLVVSDDRTIVDDISEITLAEAKVQNKDAKIGQLFYQNTSAEVIFNRVMIEDFKSEIKKNILVYHRDKEYEDFLPMLHTITQGIVKPVKKGEGNIIININGVNAILLKKETVAREHLKAGEKVFVFIKEVHKDYNPSMHQVFVSRKSPELVEELLKQIVPEIGDKILIHKVVRMPGYKTKICLDKLDEIINPVSVAVGHKGLRVKTLRRELKGEEIDFFEYNRDIKVLLSNILRKSNIVPESFDLNYNTKTITIIVPDQDIFKAIGPKGAEVVMMRQFLPEQFNNILIRSEKSAKHGAQKVEYAFHDVLNLDEEIIVRYYEAGLDSINKIITTEEEEYLKLAESVGVESDIAMEIKDRAQFYAESKFNRFLEIPGVSEELFMLHNLEPDQCIILAKNDIKTPGDLEKTDPEKLKEILRPYMHERHIADLLMSL